MVDHVYGRINILNSLKRPNIFVNELILYVEYLKKKMLEFEKNAVTNQEKYVQAFKDNLLSGINYYIKLVSYFKHETAAYIDDMKNDLYTIEKA